MHLTGAASDKTAPTVLRSVGLGVGVATLFAGASVLFVLVDGAEKLTQLGYSLGELVAAYYGAGVACGLLSGVLRPVASRGRGWAAAVGAACGSVGLPIIVLPSSSSAGWLSSIAMWGLFGAAAGAMVGFELSRPDAVDE